MQDSADQLTADGAYHCPVGSIWLFLLLYFCIHYILVFLHFTALLKVSSAYVFFSSEYLVFGGGKIIAM